MKTGHTPGPWIYRNRADGRVSIKPATPDLLAALQACVKCLNMDSDMAEDFSTEISQARAAIDKAQS